MMERSPDRDIILSYLYSLQRANCEILMTLLNKTWKNAVFLNKPLDEKNVLEQIRFIKKNGIEMLKISQVAETTLSWTFVGSKKRKHVDYEPFEKRRKMDDHPEN